MAFLQAPLPDDIVCGIEWHQHIGESDPDDLYNLSIKLFRQATEQEEAGGVPETPLLKLLAAATSMRLCDGGKPWLQPMMRMGDQRSPALEDFGEHDVLALAAAAQHVPVAWIRARLADVAVSAGIDLGVKAWKSGVQAAHDYLELSELHLLDDDGIRVLSEFQRGLALAWMYCRDDCALRDRYWTLARKAIVHSLDNRQPGVALILAAEVKRRRPDLAEELAQAFESGARGCEEATDHDTAARCYAMAQQLWLRADKRDDAKRCHLLQGEALVNRADVGSGVGLAHATWLAEGIDVLRRAGVGQDRLTELRRRLSMVQRASLDHLGRTEHSIDVSDVIREVEARVVGPTLFESLLQIAFGLASLPHHDSVRRSVLDSQTRYPLSALFASQYLNEDGAVVARRGPLNANDDESVYAAMVRQCHDFDLSFIGKVVVARGVDILFTGHHPGLGHMYEIVSASPMVPAGHELTMARGFLAGINGDWLDAAVYLCPNVEPVVRHLFHQHDLLTLALRDDGTQTEKSLTELLASDEAERVLGKDSILALQTLMVHRTGYLLRHNWAHGLVSDDALVSPAILALWWFLWRVILWPWHAHVLLRDATDEQSEHEPDSEG
jgi:hypothetical protein